VRWLLRPLAIRALRRDPRNIVRQAQQFCIRSAEGRNLVAQIGQAFIGGYNAMLDSEPIERITEAGGRVPVHFRPYFFEGAAMGYMPRAYFSKQCRADRAEQDLLRIAPEFRYLYYVGLGFWYGFRHRKRPERLAHLAPHIDPLHFPLCYDGFGFKLAFFDFPTHRDALRTIERASGTHRRAMQQGFGRGLFFVYMDDEDGFRSLLSTLEPDARDDFEFGRALARGFTGIDSAETLLPFVARGESENASASRLTGITWALTARRMNDPEYYSQCIAATSGDERALFEALPVLCEEARGQATSYLDWQDRTRAAITQRYAAWRSKAPVPGP
jgi:hypothetical protein